MKRGTTWLLRIYAQTQQHVTLCSSSVELNLTVAIFRVVTAGVGFLHYIFICGVQTQTHGTIRFFNTLKLNAWSYSYYQNVTV
jgi:hypothetical protein